MKLSLIALVALASSAVVDAHPTVSERDTGIAVLLDATSTTEAGVKAALKIMAAAGMSKRDENENDLEKRGPAVLVGGTLINSMLDFHNRARARHGAAPLVWNKNLAFAAARSAQQCIFAHTPNNPYGENVAGGTYTNPAYYAWLWYIEENKYNYNNPGFTYSTGHFTQLVWKSSMQIGCAWVRRCPGQLPFMLFCEYAAPGNVIPATYFRTNVLPPNGQAAPAQPPMNL
ncbi:hypothetical protein Dda_5731 [Drechslerella dactyloides]|uniref:SCP domain-containing protein n=1 Tax=Drechslerella dactyloides TaxID=74499 RepID=A0AAD6IYV9_DREDA|nr:hypothetical protein Dda_5731 [Drechslerella dactyloides]